MQMFPKQEVVAMLLAGGQGSRLGVLTKKLAKPAVPFGGKYRIIDFPLSNCVNSGIEAVGILTQYQPLILNEYIGNGQPWDLDGMHSGVNCLSPYQAIQGADWYSGTANAIFQNINYIERYDPDYVVILSGDHIYKMDYNKMLEYHKEKNAACTIAVIDVPMEEASRFGILNTYEDGEIYEFDEKPEHPKSTNASMGIYIFSWKELRKYTIDSLWEANMDLLDPNVTLDLKNIYSRNPMMPPHYVSPDANIQNSLVADGCNVEGDLEFSILFSGVTVGKGATVNSSIIMPGAVIEEGAVVKFAIVAENTVIKKGARVGQKPEEVDDRDNWGIAVIGENTVIPENAFVKAKEMIDSEVAASEK